MNSCLADLSHLIPSTYTKKGRGRIEKTEIIEMAIKHMKHLQSLAGNSKDNCVVPNDTGGITSSNLKAVEAGDYLKLKAEDAEDYSKLKAEDAEDYSKLKKAGGSGDFLKQKAGGSGDFLKLKTVVSGDYSKLKVGGAYLESFRQGYRECMTEALHYLVDREVGFYSDQHFSARFLNHLSKLCDSITKEGTGGSQKRKEMTWSDTCTVKSAEDKSERGEDTVKSDISDESGYSSLKQEEHFKYSDNNTQESAEQHRRNKFASESSISHSGVHDMGRVNKDDVKCSRRNTTGDYSPSMTDGFNIAALSEYPPRGAHRQDNSYEQPTDLSIKPDRDLQELAQGNLYKFKSNIRQRFSLQDNISPPSESMDSTFSQMADEGNASDPRTGGLIQENVLQPKYSVPQDFSGGRHPIAALKTEDVSQDFSSFSGQSQPLKSATPVPIFALNSSGSYYVPMTVDVSVISPFLHLYKEKECSVLHPVTISVNFQTSHVSGDSSTQRSRVIQQPSVIKHWRGQKWNL